MKALAKEMAAGLGFVTIGVAVSLAVVLVQGVEASPEEPRISWVWRGMVPFDGQQCSPYEGDPEWGQYHIPGWHTCWHLTEPGYPAIDYTRTDGQTEGSGVWLDYEGDFELFKIMPYVGYCTGVRAELYRESYDPANYRGDIHYLHIDPNPLWLYQEVPYQAIYIGDVTGEDDPNCAWTGFHLHQSADCSATTPFCSNKFVDPSQGDNWQHKVHWLPDYLPDFTNDTDCDRWKDDAEDYIGTDPYDDCTDQAGDADAWPPDINMDTWVNILDVLLFWPFFDSAAYDPRFDLNTDGRINILDILAYGTGIMGMRCTP